MMTFEAELASVYPWLLGLAKRYCQSIQDAEDLVGDTIYKVLTNKDRFEPGRALKPWCMVIMLNTYITSYNHRTLIPFVSYEDAIHAISAQSASDVLTFGDIVSIIRKCAAKSCCIECVLFYAKGYSCEEIGEKLHLPINTVRSRIHYGRKIIAHELGFG